MLSWKVLRQTISPSSDGEGSWRSRKVGAQAVTEPLVRALYWLVFSKREARPQCHLLSPAHAKAGPSRASLPIPVGTLGLGKKMVKWQGHKPSLLWCLERLHRSQEHPCRLGGVPCTSQREAEAGRPESPCCFVFSLCRTWATWLLFFVAKETLFRWNKPTYSHLAKCFIQKLFSTI